MLNKLELKYCKRCLYSTAHPLGLTLDGERVCSGCRIHEEKDTLDWDDRFEKLKALVEPYKCKTGKNYDCIVPVSGGVDSYFIVHTVKNILKLNPLLVTYNNYWNTPLGIKNLANLRIKFNCDILYQNINPISVKKITRSTLRRFGSVYWHCIAGQTVFPVQTSITHKIPLIIWGGHQGIEQVGMFSHEHEVEMSRRYRKDHDLMGFEAEDLLSIFDTIEEEDIWRYRYPSDTEINEIGVRGIYLSNYVRWDPKEQHEQMINQFGYRTLPFDRTFDCYDFVNCFNYMNMHDLLKLYKHGYSKVTDHASREIRHGRITRIQGLKLVNKYEQSEIKYIEQFCNWISIKPHSLQWMMDAHRNPKYWSESSFRKWTFNGISKQRMETGCVAGMADVAGVVGPEFFVTENDGCGTTTTNYITIGKGYPEFII